MNPDKLFDYLDGKLSRFDREQLEQQLANDPELQRELSVARRIHSRMTGESREVLLEEELIESNRGRRIVRRVAVIFIALVGANVAGGLWLIAHHESANPNRKLLEAQMRDQLSKSLNQASKNSLMPAPIGVNDITLPAASGKSDAVASEVVTIAQRLGGSATKELPDKGKIGVLVDLPSNRESEFRSALAGINGGVAPPAPSPNGTSGSEKKSFVIQIVESGAPTN